MSLHLTRRRFLGAAAALPTLPAFVRPALAAEAVLRVVAPWEYDSPDPIETGYILRRMGIGETLVGVQPDGKLVGLLAESWAVDPDHLTWRFRLRAAKFHDGTSLAAADVARTLERVRSKAESLSAIPVAELRADGDRTLVIRTKTPFAPLPSYLTDYAGVVLAPSAYDGDGRPQRPIGTGPYRVTAVQGTRTIEAEAFTDYWGAKPTIPRTRYIAVVLGDTRASMAQAGEADIAFTLLPQAAQAIERSGSARILRLTIPRVRMMTMNLRLPQFADVRVRRALSLAIDRAGIANAVLHHPPSAATQLLPPLLTGWYDPALPPLKQDVPEAKRLLAEAGWQPGADGVLVKDGQKLQAGMLVPANRPEIPVMAQAMQAQFREIGFAVDVKPGPSNALPGAVRDGSLQTALLARTYVNVPDPIGTILPDFASDHPVWTSPGFVDPDLRAIVQRYIATFDEAALPPLRKQIVTILQDQLPVIPVSWYEHNAAVSTHVALDSVTLDPFEQSYLVPAMRWA
jgi:peptide/nickel transport system substrate-binding protein